ncbi:flagellar hook assembly protein FlgD [Azorhizophilus paspali]|uniref:Basal-body rod modification protein FlgD n=1 Tax=Azorhizophilus paspali TaxID=69963 RepID=A0ABV6SHM9_AZOPA
MSTIDTSVVNAMNGTASATQSTSSSADDLRENFMTLLIAQLQNQDPLKPMENAELTSQLAQINTLNGIEELNATLEGITGQIGETQALQAAALVGRGVLVSGSQVLVGSEEATPFGIELDQAADSVKVTLADSSGTVVRQFDLGALDAGVHSFNWDALLEDGSVAPDGAYKVTVEALAEGERLSTTTLSYALVSGVTRTDSGPLLDLGALRGQVSLRDVRQIL